MTNPVPVQQHVVFLLLRRMRPPLVVLICTYAISVLGFTLIPGVDNQGQPWRMDFFHAFYFVSFMGTTIGFGEIPYPFTDTQRMWTLVTIYLTVISWLYAIGVLLAVVQDPAFRRELKFAVFVRGVKRIAEPFYLICGYGDTGSALVDSLANHEKRCVVIDIVQERIDELDLKGMPQNVPGLVANAANPEMLRAAGLTRPNCAGVIVLTNDENVNLTIAITAKLLIPGLRVVCRAETQDVEANLASFGTDYIINPFISFADRFAMALHSPSMYLIHEWFTSAHKATLMEPMTPPKGNWILCGYGRFGKAVQRYLADEAIVTTIIEADPEGTDAPEDAIIGRGTEAVTLEQANIEKANGIIAGTDNDANNLSIIMTARELKSDLFTVARQNDRSNDALFAAAGLDLVVQRGNVIARKISALTITPLLGDFLKLSRGQDETWANILISRISGVTGKRPPETWSITISESESPALHAALEENLTIRLSDINRDPRNRQEQLSCMPLMIKRKEHFELLPEEDTGLNIGDEILYCGRLSAMKQMRWATHNYNVLIYLRTGIEKASAWMWRRLTEEEKKA